MDERYFISKNTFRNGKGKYPEYVVHNGVIKEYIPSPLSQDKISDSKLYYCLDDIPNPLRSILRVRAVKESTLVERVRRNGIMSDPNTPILPIVGNLLPSDGVNAYTVVFNNGLPELRAFLVCWDFHWSELYTGQTGFGYNVFCLVEDLTPEQRDNYIDKIITLGEVQKYLDMHKNEKEDNYQFN